MKEMTEIVADLRRRAKALDDAADLLEQEFIERDAPSPRPERWAPGQGQVETVPATAPKAPPAKKPAPAPATGKKKPAPPARAATRPAPRPAPAPAAEETDEEPAVSSNTMRQVVKVVKEVANAIGGAHSPHLAATVINYLAGRGLPCDADTVEKAITAARREEA